MKRILALIPLLAVPLAVELQAQTPYSWQATSTAAFEDSANWSPSGGPPTSADDVQVGANRGTMLIDGTTDSVKNFVAAPSGTWVLEAKLPGADQTTSNTLTINGDFTKSGSNVTIRDFAGGSNNLGRLFLNILGNFDLNGGGIVFGVDGTASLSGLTVGGSFTQSTASEVKFYVDDARLNGGITTAANGKIDVYQANGIGGISAGSLTSSGTNGVIQAASVAGSTATLTIDGARGSQTYGGTLADGAAGSTLAIAKTGANVQVLSGANTYTGGTTISAGTMVAAGGTALGAGDITIDGGVLDLDGANALNLAMGVGADFSISGGELDLSLGTAFDQITGSGTFLITGGTLNLDITGSGFDYASAYNIFDGFSTGSASGLTITGYDSGAYTALLSDSGVLTFQTTAVPEPATFGLILGAVGLALITVARRRRPGRC